MHLKPLNFEIASIILLNHAERKGLIGIYDVCKNRNTRLDELLRWRTSFNCAVAIGQDV